MLRARRAAGGPGPWLVCQAWKEVGSLPLMHARWGRLGVGLSASNCLWGPTQGPRVTLSSPYPFLPQKPNPYACLHGGDVKFRSLHSTAGVSVCS